VISNTRVISSTVFSTNRAVLVSMLREGDQKIGVSMNSSLSWDIPTAMSACRIRASCLRL
jgi:hypothetical protein